MNCIDQSTQRPLLRELNGKEDGQSTSNIAFDCGGHVPGRLVAGDGTVARHAHRAHRGEAHHHLALLGVEDGEVVAHRPHPPAVTPLGHGADHHGGAALAEVAQHARHRGLLAGLLGEPALLAAARDGGVDARLGEPAVELVEVARRAERPQVVEIVVVVEVVVGIGPVVGGHVRDTTHRPTIHALTDPGLARSPCL